MKELFILAKRNPTANNTKKGFCLVKETTSKAKVVLVVNRMFRHLFESYFLRYVQQSKTRNDETPKISPICDVIGEGGGGSALFC